jgi:hypothetical protein
MVAVRSPFFGLVTVDVGTGAVVLNGGAVASGTTTRYVSVTEERQRTRVSLFSGYLQLVRDASGALTFEGSDELFDSSYGLCSWPVQSYAELQTRLSASVRTSTQALVAGATCNATFNATVPPPEQPCSGKPFAAQAVAYCELLTAVTGPYAACHGVVAPLQFYQACLVDVCRGESVFSGTSRRGRASCSAFVAYEEACHLAGVVGISSAIDKCDVCGGDGTTCEGDYNSCYTIGGRAFYFLDRAFLSFDVECEYVFVVDCIGFWDFWVIYSKDNGIVVKFFGVQVVRIE